MIIITKDMETLKSNLYKHNIALLELQDLDCEGNRDGAHTFLKPKNKYVYVDFGNKENEYHSGKWLIDQENNVWNIKAYGVKNHLLGSITELNHKILLDLKNISEALEKKNLTGSYGDIAISI